MRESRTYRRRLLDDWLFDSKDDYHGVVIDVGGKRVNKRGQFRPPITQCRLWVYINTDSTVAPTVVADGVAMPIASESADVVLCTEVLEHVSDPAQVVSEIHRVLKPGGVVVASVPFLFPIHGDPHDFQRFTHDGLRHLFRDFATIDIQPMGREWGTLGMLVSVASRNVSSRALRAAARLFAALCIHVERRSLRKRMLNQPRFTTGYAVKCQR